MYSALAETPTHSLYAEYMFLPSALRLDKIQKLQ